MVLTEALTAQMSSQLRDGFICVGG